MDMIGHGLFYQNIHTYRGTTDKALWWRSSLKFFKVWHSSFFGEAASKQSGPTQCYEIWKCVIPQLGGSFKRCHLCHSGCHLDLRVHELLMVSSSGLRCLHCEFSGGRTWSETLWWMGLFVNSNRQLWRAIKNSNYVNRPEKNDCLQKSVAITRHNGSQLGWRGFSVIHNSLS